MIKFLGIVIVLGGVFWAGYYVGQQPPEKVKETLRTMSENVVERTLGLDEGRLNLKEEFLEAKSRLLEGKAEILDGEYGEAAEELGQALDHLKKAVSQRTKNASQTVIDGLMAKLQKMKDSLASGKQVSQEQIDAAQQELDQLISGE